MNPFFSIIIPCFNQGNYIKDAIESILSQDYDNWELILVNDGSSDNTLDIISLYKEKDPRIILISHENKGLSYSRNAGINLARGEFILFLDSDDWILNGCLIEVKNAIFLNPSYAMYQVGYTYFFDNEPIHTNCNLISGFFLKTVVKNNIGPCHSIFLRLSEIKKIGFFDLSLKSCEDWDFWIRAAKLGFEICSIPKSLVAYRYISGSMSKNPIQMYEALCKVSTRASQADSRIPLAVSLNQDFDFDLEDQFKQNFIKCLGVSLFQGKLEESITWYKKETQKFQWFIKPEEWDGLSSNLSFKYFLTPSLIPQVLENSMPLFSNFLNSIGYTQLQTQTILKRVFLPQLKKSNHLKYGKFLGGIINKLSY